MRHCFQVWECGASVTKCIAYGCLVIWGVGGRTCAHCVDRWCAWLGEGAIEGGANQSPQRSCMWQEGETAAIFSFFGGPTPHHSTRGEALVALLGPVFGPPPCMSEMRGTGLISGIFAPQRRHNQAEQPSSVSAGGDPTVGRLRLFRWHCRLHVDYE